MTNWWNDAKKTSRRRRLTRPATSRRPLRTTQTTDYRLIDAGRRAARAAAAHRAAAPGLPLGSRADGAHDRPAHGRGGLRGRRRSGRGRRRQARWTSSATSSSRSTSSRCCSPSAARATSSRSRAGSTRSSSRRHPHVFGEVEARTAGRVRENWERIKREQEGREGIFHDVPVTCRRCIYARKLQRRAAAVGFEYPDIGRRARRSRGRVARAERGAYGSRGAGAETEPDPESQARSATFCSPA